MFGEQSITTGLAGRYALALFELVQDAHNAQGDEGAQDKIHDDVASLAVLLRTSPDLQKLIRNPLIGAGEQAAALEAILNSSLEGGITDNKPHILKTFVAFLVSKRRVALLGDITRAYGQLLAASRDELTAELRSAHAFDAGQMTALAAALKKSLGKTIHINAQTDAALLGGFVLKLGSRMIDGSLSTQLNSLQNTMNEVR